MKRLRESLTAYLKGHSSPPISSLFEGGSRPEIVLLFNAACYGKLHGDFFFGMRKVLFRGFLLELQVHLRRLEFSDIFCFILCFYCIGS